MIGWRNNKKPFENGLGTRTGLKINNNNKKKQLMPRETLWMTFRKTGKLGLQSSVVGYRSKIAILFLPFYKRAWTWLNTHQDTSQCLITEGVVNQFYIDRIPNSQTMSYEQHLVEVGKKNSFFSSSFFKIEKRTPAEPISRGHHLPLATQDAKKRQSPNVHVLMWLNAN